MKMLYCAACDLYTLKEECRKCGGKTVSPKPARFSPEDPRGSYRRKLKMEAWRERDG